MFPNWKTTAGGVGALLIPTINAIIPILPPQWAVVATGASAFLGLLFAKDATGGK